MRFQFMVCLACLLMHLFLVTRIGIAQYDSRVVSEWNTFLQEVQAANADGLAPLMKKLTSGEPVKWPPHLALMARELIAKRFLELKRSKEAIEAFDELLNSPLPNEAQEAQLFAGVWSRALNALCMAYAENEQLERIMPRLNAIDREQGSYLHQVNLTQVVLDWERQFTADAIMRDKATHALKKFSREFPELPSDLEIQGLSHLARCPGCFKTSSLERLKIFRQCQLASIRMLERSGKGEEAVLYFYRFADACYDIAKIYVKDTEKRKYAESLVGELETAGGLLLNKFDSFRESVERSTTDLRKYIDGKLVASAASQPRVHDSMLIERKVPDISDGIVVNGSLPKFGKEDSSVVLLDFWEAWCAPCVDAFPDVKTLDEKYGPKGLEIVGVTSVGNGRWDDQTRAFVPDPFAKRGQRILAMKKFIKDRRPAGTQVIDQFDTIKKEFEIVSFPTYVLIDRQGIVKLVAGGGEEAMKLIDREISELLK